MISVGHEGWALAVNVVWRAENGFHNSETLTNEIRAVMHRAGARFLYGTFSERGRGQSAGPGKCKRRTDLPANVRNTAVKCGKRVRTVRMRTFALANVCVLTVRTCPYMSVPMTPFFF